VDQDTARDLVDGRASMTTVPDSPHGTELARVDGDAVVRRTSRREKLEALGLLLGMLSILVGLALRVGVTLPFGP
jgi:hypothetical protein